MEFDLITMRLEMVMEQPGCPICRRRSDTELGYIRDLLWEHMNDGATRSRIIASLGFCPRHVWQINTIEIDEFGGVLETLRLYQQLAHIIEARLTDYAHHALRSRIPRWWRGLSFQRIRVGKLKGLLPHAQCRVCQFGDETVQIGLEWLVKGLSSADRQFQERYTRSDGLCFAHLRQAFMMTRPSTTPGARFLAEDAIRRLGALQVELDELAAHELSAYGNGRHGQDKPSAWREVLTFFGGNAEAITRIRENLRK
jgi:hypothetical protein